MDACLFDGRHQAGPLPKARAEARVDAGHRVEPLEPRQVSVGRLFGASPQRHSDVPATTSRLRHRYATARVEPAPVLLGCGARGGAVGWPP